MWKAALDEAQYVAGGLVGRPAESTRHYTIIRHSHVLVWYRGPSTSVTITVLADEPVPASRRLWLQARGYSGHLGMAVKALVGAHGDWLDVTPAREAHAEHMDEVDERGIQRDLGRFAKNASGRACAHVPRETHVVRIPAAAADGYYRLVLCPDSDTRTILCGSPVFRIASTSADSAVVRGASLATMPLEVGIKVASTIGQKYAGVVAAVAQNRAAKAAQHVAVRTALRGYRTTELSDAVNDGWQKSEQERRWDRLCLEPAAAVVGPDAGPEAPFPLSFGGGVVTAAGQAADEAGHPTVMLKEVPDTITARLAGAFAAWVLLPPAKGLHDVNGWHEAVVTIAPPHDAPPAVAVRSRVVVHIASDLAGAALYDARLEVLLMGFLGPQTTTQDPSVQAAQLARDVATTRASLGRDNWLPHETVSRMRTNPTSFSDALVEAAGRVQEQLERVPLHWVGVRSDSAALRDQAYGKGGLWIAR